MLLARPSSGEGRSRAYVGGSLPSPPALLAELAETMPGRARAVRPGPAAAPAHQRDALDRYAGSRSTAPLAAYAKPSPSCARSTHELGELTTRDRERAQEADLLRFGLAEIEAVDPQPARRRRSPRRRTGWPRRHAAYGGRRAHDALLGAGDGPEGADAAALVAAARAEPGAAGAHDQALAALAGRLRELGYLLTDVAGELASYATGIDVDPARLAAVRRRRAALTRLIRKYGDDERHGVTEVLAWSQRAAERVTTLDSDDDRITALTARRVALVDTLTATAEGVSAARTAAAQQFSAAVSGELPGAGHARRARRGSGQPARAPTTSPERACGRWPPASRSARHGVDDVEMLLCPHAGAPGPRRCSAVPREASCRA